MFISQYSSCPPVIFAVTANDSQECCDFHHSDDTSLFSPCLKGCFLLVLSRYPLTPVKKLACSGPHEQAQWEIYHCLYHYSISRAILPLTLPDCKSHVCEMRQTFLLLRAAIHKHPRQPERTAAHFSTRAQKQVVLCNNRRN